MFLSFITRVCSVTSTTGAGISSSGRCNEGGFKGINKIRPHYPLVDPSNPQPTVEGTVEETHITHEDLPFDHTSHDNNMHVKLDSPFQNLNSFGNEPQTSTNINDKRTEVEWEIGTANDGRTDRFPKDFWPSAGDRVWMIGRYIFDCGHPDFGPRTEIHPLMQLLLHILSR